MKPSKHSMLVFGAILASSLPAQASDFTGRVIVRMQTEVDTMRLLVHGNKYLLQRTVDGAPAEVLVDRKSQVVNAWSTAEKEYHESSMSNPLVAFLDPFAAIEAEETMSESAAQKIGSENVEGYACDKFVVKMKDGTELVDYWIAQKFGFPIKIVEPETGGMTLAVDEIKEEPVDGALMQVPAGLTLAVEPGEGTPAWSGDLTKAKFVKIPCERVMSAGEIICVKPRIGEKIEVQCKNADSGTQFCGVPFKDGKPTENYMMDTFTLNGPTETWTKSFDPFSANEDELVVRLNKGHGLIIIRPAEKKD